MKKILQSLVIIAIVFMVTVAAVTLKTNQAAQRGFVANAYSADFSTCETLRAAVTGQSIYVERIILNAHDAETVTFGAGETSDNVTAVVLGPLSLSADTVVDILLSRPLQIAEATAFVIDAAGSGDVTVIVQGYVK